MNTSSERGKWPARDAGTFLEYVQFRMTMQDSAITAIDDKIIQLFTIATALLTVLAALIALDGFTVRLTVIAVIDIAAFCIVADRCFGAYRERKWKHGPDIRQVWDDWDESEALDEELRWKLARAIWRSHSDNAPLVDRKGNDLPWIIGAVLIQTVLLVAALALVALD